MSRLFNEDIFKDDFFGEGLKAIKENNTLLIQGNGRIRDINLLKNKEILKEFTSIKISEEVILDDIFPRYSFVNPM